MDVFNLDTTINAPVKITRGQARLFKTENVTTALGRGCCIICNKPTKNVLIVGAWANINTKLLYYSCLLVRKFSNEDVVWHSVSSLCSHRCINRFIKANKAAVLTKLIQLDLENGN